MGVKMGISNTFKQYIGFRKIASRWVCNLCVNVYLAKLTSGMNYCLLSPRQNAIRDVHQSCCLGVLIIVVQKHQSLAQLLTDFSVSSLHSIFPRQQSQSSAKILTGWFQLLLKVLCPECVVSSVIITAFKFWQETKIASILNFLDPQQLRGRGLKKGFARQSVVLWESIIIPYSVTSLKPHTHTHT